MAASALNNDKLRPAAIAAIESQLFDCWFIGFVHKTYPAFDDAV